MIKMQPVKKEVLTQRDYDLFRKGSCLIEYPDGFCDYGRIPSGILLGEEAEYIGTKEGLYGWSEDYRTTVHMYKSPKNNCAIILPNGLTIENYRELFNKE